MRENEIGGESGQEKGTTRKKVSGQFSPPSPYPSVSRAEGDDAQAVHRGLSPHRRRTTRGEKTTVAGKRERESVCGNEKKAKSKVKGVRGRRFEQRRRSVGQRGMRCVVQQPSQVSEREREGGEKERRRVR